MKLNKDTRVLASRNVELRTRARTCIRILINTLLLQQHIFPRRAEKDVLLE